MYETEYQNYHDVGYTDGYAEFDESDIDPDAWQESCWTVISAYFDEKGLVRMQLDSFDEFIQVAIQRIVEESPAIELQGELQHTSLELDEEPLRYKIKFDQIYLSQAIHWEKDGTTTRLTPYQARLRGLTYSAPLYGRVVKYILHIVVFKILACCDVSCPRKWSVRTFREVNFFR